MGHFRFILLTMFLLISPQLTLASSIKQLNVPELLAQSEIVFEGEVVNQESRWNDTQTDIYTQITFRVDDVVVGSYSSNTLVLTFVGGTVDQTSVSIEGSEMPALNESGVYFISSTTKRLVNPIAGWAQGHFITAVDEQGTPRIMTQDRTPVAGIDLSQAKSKFISDGVATGVTRSTTNAISGAMSLTDFKTLLIKQATTRSSN